MANKKSFWHLADDVVQQQPKMSKSAEQTWLGVVKSINNCLLTIENIS